ncbi:MAG: pyruvate kinase [Dysgonamonadaceae bacterium]|jgi:pyruvate kinase|nr:pyruvate kinase [Dysgonamonadaceae bacterium]
MLKQTKIVATVSDKRCDIEFITDLFNAGMNVVRMNSAHLDTEGFDKIIRSVRTVSNRIGILIDTKGPEVRTTLSDEPIPFKTGDRVKIQGAPFEKTMQGLISVNYTNFANELKTGDIILIDDGDLELKVIGKHPGYLLVEAVNDAVLGSRKSVNIPGVRINLPSLTEKDRENILYAIKNQIDFIAHSFVRTKQDVLDIQRILDEHHSPIKIIAKIENQEGVDNIDEILEVAYGIMVARGDLGIEVPQEKIPGLQRILIRKCVAAKKPVIVATQMLHSMITNPRPTRAEVTDVANAIYYRTDALMLSGETAYGKFPVEAVRTMSSIAREAEKTKLLENDIRVPTTEDDLDVTSFLSKQAVKSSIKLHVKAIVTDSYSGRTARNLAAFRGKAPVFAICYKEQTTRELSLSYGVWAEYQAESEDPKQYFLDALNKLIQKQMIDKDDMVAYLSGSFGEGGGTSFLEINNVSRILDGSENFRPPFFKRNNT